MKRYDKKYCHPCMIDHWVETTNRHRDRCNGTDYLPTDTATHYIRWNAGGLEEHERHYPLMPADQDEQRPANWLELGL